MARPKSFLQPIEITCAGKAHNCQHDSKHRLTKGDKRLSVADGRSVEHFCVECACKFLRADMERLQQLLDSLEG